MKLDTRAMRHLTAEDWRVLTAVESGSRNHELVPTRLIEKIARLRGGPATVHRSISTLAKAGLIARLKEAKYDGYRLTYGGLDYLALHTHASRRHLYSVGSRVGVGKESDIILVADHAGTQRILKIHRLGRISFRSVKANRDYLKNRSSASWMYLSRLAAMKEFAFMKALHAAGFPVPEPLAQSRHTILMSLIDAPPLRQISSVPDPASLYADLIALILRLAKHGLIHADFNEFNILIREDKSLPQDPDQPPSITLVPIIIDFPQMVSMQHPNAQMYFDRDVNCIKRFFQRRFHFTSSQPGPFFHDASQTLGHDSATRLDATAEASGFTKKMLKDLEAAIKHPSVADDDHPSSSQQEATDSSSSDQEDSTDDDELDDNQQPIIIPNLEQHDLPNTNPRDATVEPATP